MHTYDPDNEEHVAIIKAAQELKQSFQPLVLLDHGYVRLIDWMGSDLSVVRNARVSHDAEWRTGENEGKDEKLVNYLYTNQHNTPFESVTFTFEVKAPIFVFRQWHRHRTWSYNEVSARYTKLPAEFYLPQQSHIGTQDKKNHQSRNMGENNADEQLEDVTELMQAQNEYAFGTYHQLLEDGVPREIARSVLPVATYSRMFATVNLHNLFRFLSERCDSHAQYEIRVYAEAMLELIEPIVPVAVAAWKTKNGEIT